MKMNSWKVTIMLLAAFLAGAAVMHWWDNRLSPYEVPPMEGEALAVELMNMQDASMAKDVQEVKTDKIPQEVTIPSQLSKIESPEIEMIIGRSGATFSPETEDPAVTKEAIDLQNVSYKTLPPLQDASAAETESKIVMIEAPVEVKLINSLDEYREFKRQARGSYPEVDFKKQQVLVLESASNLPDKAFEIVAVSDENGKRLVTYRINVFGLDKKINTHSAKAIDKKDLPLELKQIL